MRTHKCNARNEKNVQRIWSEWMVMVAQPSLHPTVAAGFHPCVAGMHLNRRIGRTAPMNVVVDKRSQRRQWRLLLCRPRRHPRLRQCLNYCPLEVEWGTLWKMRSRRTCTRLTPPKSLQDRTQDCLYETWVRDCNDGKKENISETMLTTSGIRFTGVPLVFILDCVVIMVLFRKNFKTNRDIENSPVRNTNSRRDRVWEPGNQIQCQMQ
jgi:hypothetical protein